MWNNGTFSRICTNQNQGIGIHKLYTTQGFVHIRVAIDHIWGHTETENLLRTSMEHIKHEAGIRRSLFHHDYDKYGVLCKDMWVKYLWKFVQESGIDINDDSDDFEFTQEGDTALASAMSRKGEWSQANKCRKYLKVLTVIDIASEDGRTIDTHILRGCIQRDRIRKLECSTHGRPKVGDWIVWRKLLKLVLTGSHGHLCNPLSRWVENVKELYDNEWQWFCDGIGEVLYMHEEGNLRLYDLARFRQRIQNRVNQFQTYRILACQENVVSLRRTSVSFTCTSLTSKGYSTVLDKKAEEEIPQPLRQRLQQALATRDGEQYASMGVGNDSRDK